MWSHSKASFSDPGVVLQPKHNLDFSNNQIDTNAAMLENGVRNREWSICSKCETYRPPKAHHCRICRKCIRKMDHHCPWINNCVGEFNQKIHTVALLVEALLFGIFVTAVMTDQ
ncbi:Dnz1-like protein [Dinothrombium tinctorium]|uniref:Palmitoyltransferase n=1 Tax=Dinothrombium tinctorium TaxID=1965070 RepID=A0A443RFM6_9ACAR|nr:Dnz1-like protein [Dinothrombium tinctorium]